MFERILVPLDGSPRAEMILPQLGRILRHEDAEILLVRAVYVPPMPPDWGMATDDLRRREREEAQRYLHDVARRFSEKGAKVHGRVLMGRPPEAILDAVYEEEASLIAMATHGRGGLARFAFGSVAEKLLRTADVPLLLVRSFRPTPEGDLEPQTPEELPFRRILVPFDGSSTAAAGLGPAVKFAQLFNSTGVILHVVPPYVPPGPILPGMEPIFPPAIPEPDAEEDGATAAAASRFEAVDLPVVRRTVLGDPASAILDHAFEEGIDLIAMATHGRSGLSRWSMGSVAERVLRASTVPMLITRASGQDARRREPAGAGTSRSR
jgi:nucleotide-binding universal stress UspA family protein